MSKKKVMCGWNLSDLTKFTTHKNEEEKRKSSFFVTQFCVSDSLSCVFITNLKRSYWVPLPVLLFLFVLRPPPGFPKFDNLGKLSPCNRSRVRSHWRWWMFRYVLSSFLNEHTKICLWRGKARDKDNSHRWVSMWWETKRLKRRDLNVSHTLGSRVEHKWCRLLALFYPVPLTG